jgi:3-deoxy-D-arabino-heptulosonate 7-phosphate (DAHP) synthase
MLKWKEQQKLYEMANISKEKTGLPLMVWISYQTGKEKHGARIKIRIGTDWIPITVSDAPEIKSSNVKIKSKVLNSIFAWIVLNKKCFSSIGMHKANLVLIMCLII